MARLGLKVVLLSCYLVGVVALANDDSTQVEIFRSTHQTKEMVLLKAYKNSSRIWSNTNAFEGRNNSFLGTSKDTSSLLYRKIGLWKVELDKLSVESTNDTENLGLHAWKVYIGKKRVPSGSALYRRILLELMTMEKSTYKKINGVEVKVHKNKKRMSATFYDRGKVIKKVNGLMKKLCEPFQPHFCYLNGELNIHLP